MQLAKLQGGTTLSINTGNEADFASGYIVGVKKLYSGLFSDADIPVLAAQLSTVSNEMHFGSWLADGILHLDIVRHVESLGRALEIARNNNELAIWDCANKRDIYVDSINPVDDDR
jgi:hypothetical protein